MQEKKYSDDELVILIKENIASVSHYEAEQISLSDRLVEDLQLDSLDLIGLVVDFETQYDIKIDEIILDGIITVQDCLDLVKKYL